MSRIRFKRTVLRATLELVQQSYQLSNPQPAARAVQFYKKPAPGVCCYIEFDLKDWPTPTGREFDVILQRRRLPDFLVGAARYEPIGTGLSNLMRYVYGREDVPRNTYWGFNDEQSLYTQVTHVQSLLIDYAISWLDDPLTSDPWQVPTKERDAFRRMLVTVVASALQPYGYELLDVPVADLPIFIKRGHDDLNRMIEFRQSRHLDLSAFRIDVRLYRKFGENPYLDQPKSYHGWLDTRLDNLLRPNFGIYPAESVSLESSHQEDSEHAANEDSPLTIIPWRYTEQAELDRQINDILEKLKYYAISWLEDPESANPTIGFGTI